MRYLKDARKSLAFFFLISCALHLVILYLYGQAFPPRKNKNLIAISLISSQPDIALRQTRAIPQPLKSMEIMQPSPALKEKMALSGYERTIPFEISHDAGAEIKREPDPEACAGMQIQSILKGIRDIPMPHIPMSIARMSSGPNPPQSASTADGKGLPDAIPRTYSVQDETDAYKDLIFERIERLKHYPRAARREGMQGTVRLEFQLYRDGTLGDIKVIASSRFAILDNAAIENVRAVCPFPPFPAGIKEKSIWVEVPIEYKLTRKTSSD